MKSFVRLSVLALALLPSGCANGYADAADPADPAPASSNAAHETADADPAIDAMPSEAALGVDAAPEADGTSASDAAADAAQDEHPVASDPAVDSGAWEAGSDSPPPAACQGTMADCDLDPSQTCETDLRSDPLHCGKCGNACPSPSTCVNATCLNQCAPMTGDCNGVLSDGCEADLDEEENCGGCGKACPPVAFGSPICWDAVCYTYCDEGRRDCDQVYDNGCEIDSAHDVTNCGACGHACSFAHAATTCESGTCAMGACDTGWGDCNGDPSDGCEVDLTTGKNCGFCGHDCGGGLPCEGGACDPQLVRTPIAVADAAVFGQVSIWAAENGLAFDAGPGLLDSNTGEAVAVDGDASGMYWLGSNGRLFRATSTSHPYGLVTLASDILNPKDIAVDSKYVYVLANDRVGRVSKSGGAITLLASNMAAVGQIAVDSDWIYTFEGKKVSRMAKSGSLPQLLATASAPVLSIEAHGGYLYWAVADEIWRAPSAGGTPEHVVSAPDIGDFFVTDSALYFGSGNAVARLGAKGLQVLSAGSLSVTRIVVANGFVWWSNSISVFRSPS